MKYELVVVPDQVARELLINSIYEAWLIISGIKYTLIMKMKVN